MIKKVFTVMFPFLVVVFISVFVISGDEGFTFDLQSLLTKLKVGETLLIGDGNIFQRDWSMTGKAWSGVTDAFNKLSDGHFEWIDILMPFKFTGSFFASIFAFMADFSKNVVVGMFNFFKVILDAIFGDYNPFLGPTIISPRE